MCKFSKSLLFFVCFILGEKFAGRASAPPPSDLPKPAATWQQQQGSYCFQ